MTRFPSIWLTVGILGALVPASASAKDRDRFELSVRFEPLPNLGLQPEAARLHLDLPRELLPVRELWYGFDFDGRIREWRIPSLASTHARFGIPHAKAFVGTALEVDVEAPARNVRFRMALMPRMALAELAF